MFRRAGFSVTNVTVLRQGVRALLGAIFGGGKGAGIGLVVGG